MAKAINEYFTPLIGASMTTAQLDLICGSGSMLKMIYIQVNFGVLVDPTLKLNNRIDMAKIIPAQLGYSAITNSPNITMKSVAPLLSVASLNEAVGYPPEFGAFVLDPTRGNSDAANLLTYDSSLDIYAQDLESLNSMLNTEATFNFFTAYETQDMSTMVNRFGFTTWTQVDLYRNYLDDLADHFLMKNATYDIIALASLMDKNMNNTASYINSTLPLDVTTRVTASLMQTASSDCSIQWQAATVEPATADTICANYDFSDPNSLKSFMEMLWTSNTDAEAEFMSTYGVT